MISDGTKTALRKMAHEMNEAIGEQEGYDPVGKDWLYREFLAVCILGYDEGYQDGYDKCLDDSSDWD